MTSYINMGQLIRKIIAIVIFKINRRKLIFLCGFLTIGSFLIQICTTPHPLSELKFRETHSILLYNPLYNPIHLGQNHSKLVDNRIQNVLDSPKVVSLYSFPKVNRSNVSSKKEEKVYVQRTRENSLMSSNKVVTSQPLIVKILPSHVERNLLSLTPNEALAFVKNDIENAPLVRDEDPELYTPIFRNVTTFKRSYIWMERLLKVYIYPDGKRPIFHQPQLRGIYASEGWFMKLMEGNRQFVTKEPKKAHLFYLPYSARQLQITLYVRNSHNMKPLSFFLRDYVNMIATKYPFWNRTHGSDHFLVACHDWGPYTLTEHMELTKNTIKVLCNADVSQWIFNAAKDVSLPETMIQNPRNPTKNLGGRRVSQRRILAFFAGNNHGRVRPILLKHWNNKDKDMKIYGPLPKRVSRVMSYAQHMKSSKYCICPMGFEVNSPRIVEAIYYECVPVIIADNFVPPLDDVLNWSAFSVIIVENDIPKLKEILLSIPWRRYLVMQRNLKRVQKHFIWNARPVRYDLFHMILHSIWSSRVKNARSIRRL